MCWKIMKYLAKNQWPTIISVSKKVQPTLRQLNFSKHNIDEKNIEKINNDNSENQTSWNVSA